MTHTYTYTSVYYFTDEQLAPLKELIKELYEDFKDRCKYFTVPEIGDAFGRRFEVLRSAIDLLGEPVQREYGA